MSEPNEIESAALSESAELREGAGESTLDVTESLSVRYRGGLSETNKPGGEGGTPGAPQE